MTLLNTNRRFRKKRFFDDSPINGFEEQRLEKDYAVFTICTLYPSGVVRTFESDRV